VAVLSYLLLEIFTAMSTISSKKMLKSAKNAQQLINITKILEKRKAFRHKIIYALSFFIIFLCVIGVSWKLFLSKRGMSIIVDYSISLILSVLAFDALVSLVYTTTYKLAKRSSYFKSIAITMERMRLWRVGKV